MRVITIIVDGPTGRLDVAMDGRVSGGLCFGEMLEQVTSLTHPHLGTPAYPMRTPEEWQARHDRAVARREAGSKTTIEGDAP